MVLTDDLFINRGRVRLCYRHSTRRELVVKVPAGSKSEQLKANMKEYKGYHELVRRHGLLACISHCHGFTATDRGDGLLCDCIRDEDGRISRTIWEIIIHQADCDLDRVISAVRKFCTYLVRHDIWIFDLNLKNIALRRELNGVYSPIVLDLKGRYDNQEFIPVSSHIGFFARRKMARRTRQLLERIESFHADRHRLQAEHQPMPQRGL